MMLKENLYGLIHKQPYGTDEVINIYDIYIPEDFRTKESRPSKKKMIECRQKFHKLGFLDKPIEVKKQDGYKKLLLVDKYTRLCVGFEMGLKYVPIKYID